MNQIEIRIRHEDDARAVPFGTWDLPRLDDLIPLIESWGVSYRSASEPWVVSGEFRLEDGAAFFELLLSDPEDPTS